jgi:Tol biopolymer transport system component
MSPRLRWSLAALFVVVAALAAAVGSPRGRATGSSTVYFDSNRTTPGDPSANYELYSMNADGSNQVRLTSDDSYDSWWAKPSPDGSKILFIRTPAGTHDTDYKKVSTWVMNADGSDLHEIVAAPGVATLPDGSPSIAAAWGFEGHPEWSPDGTKLVMIGGPSSNSQIYITSSDGTGPVRLTSDGAVGLRPGTNVDPSWSPDGAKILFIGCPMAACTSVQYEVYRINRDGTGEARLTSDLSQDNDPYYSPDGTSIAWLRNALNLKVAGWGIYLMNGDGSGQHAVIDDGEINSKPGWFNDGSTIYFHRTIVLGHPFNVWRINPDGTGLAEVITPEPSYANEYPSQ